MSPIDRLIYQRPALFVSIVTLPIAALVWWLTGDASPLP